MDRNAVVLQRIDLAADLMILRVAPEGWPLPVFSPGQYAVLGLLGEEPRCEGAAPEEEVPPPDELIRRAYSIASPSKAGEYLEFLIVRVLSGALTPRLFALRAGAKLWLGPKVSGMFTLKGVPENANLIFIATGTGIAPYMSMLRSQPLANSARRVLVLHGARNSWELAYRSELELLAAVHPSFQYIPSISRPGGEPAPWTGRTGRLQEQWAVRAVGEAWGFDPKPAETHVFLCGNPRMINEFIEILGREGFREHTRAKPGDIHIEKYW